MKILRFNDIAELSAFMYNSAKAQTVVIAAVCFFDRASELIKELLSYSDVEIGSIKIEHEDYSGYDKELYVTLDSDLILDVFPAYLPESGSAEEGYIDIVADVIIYDGDTNSRIAIQSECQNKCELDLQVDDCGDCCYDCSNCPLHKTRNEHGDSMKTLDLLEYIINR